MNRWYFAIRFDPRDGLGSDREAWVSTPQLLIEVHNLHPQPRQYVQGQRRVYIFGNPIVDGLRDDDAVLRALRGVDVTAEAARTLNGSFLVLIHDPSGAQLSVINDRFAALAVYHRETGGVWCASSSLKWMREKGHGEGGLDEIAAAEFLFLRRLLGEKTLESNIRYLDSASLLQLGRKGARREQYWAPDYNGPQISDRELPDRIADSLKACVSAHLSDGQKTGLLLSGGLDSRALLAAMERPPVCFTTCQHENNESAVARSVAEAAGAQFRFVPRPPDLYEGKLDDAVFLTGGQQLYSEAQFIDYAHRWPEQVGTFFIGLGLDIFYGGLYLPKATPYYFGRRALHYRLKPLNDDLASMYLDNVSYRLKQTDPNLVVRRSARSGLRDRLLASINEIMDRGRRLGAGSYDLWEFMHIHNLSRHYSFPMIMSTRSYADCRAPALDNGVLELSICMQAKQKVNGTAYQKAIALLAPELMNISNANTNLPAGIPLPRQTAIKAARYAANRIFRLPYPVAPGAGERSWPSPRESLLACPSIVERTKALAGSDYLGAIPFIDMAGIKTAVDEFLSGQRDHAVLLNVLLTLDGYHRPA